MVILLLLIAAAVELAVHVLPPNRKVLRNTFSIVTLLALVAAAATVMVYRMNVFSCVLFVLFGYRAFNMARVLKGRMHELYLWRVTYRTSLWLIITQFIVLGAEVAWPAVGAPLRGALYVALAMQLGISALFVVNVRGHAKRMQRTASLLTVHDIDLPSITVAIPARNETDELHDCITSLLAVQYPKLEILVLDDCSQTRRTPEIIRSFAHDGVRFIQGAEPRNAWLAKNQAYDALAKAASGEYIVFAGVDVRFEPGSLRKLVAFARERHKSMVCVMPRNDLSEARLPLIQPMRYVWELALPRKLIGKPPVLSSCWLISKKALQAAGGFEAASRMIVPEAYFAGREAEHDGYSFMAGGDSFGIMSLKTPTAQRDTAIRVAYPQTHRRPEVVLLVTLGYASWIVLPLCAIVGMLVSSLYMPLLLLVVCILLLNALAYATVLHLAYGKMPIVPLVALPLAALVSVVLLNYSMYKYEFSEVIWKGRNVCLPVMHVIPRLPQI